MQKIINCVFVVLVGCVSNHGHVNPVSVRIEIEGSVRIPGTYNAASEASLEEVIELAGGPMLLTTARRPQRIVSVLIVRVKNRELMRFNSSTRRIKLGTDVVRLVYIGAKDVDL